MRLKIVLLVAAVCPLQAQWISYPTVGVPRTPDGKPNLGAACPRTAEGKPDLSGLWIMQTKRPGNADFPGCDPVADEFINIAQSIKGGLPYQPRAADWSKQRRTEQRVNDPMSRCAPIGPIRMHTWNGPRKMVQSPGLLIILNELGTSYRQIYTDGRPLPADPNPSGTGIQQRQMGGAIR